MSSTLPTVFMAYPLGYLLLNCRSLDLQVWLGMGSLRLGRFVLINSVFWKKVVMPSTLLRGILEFRKVPLGSKTLMFLRIGWATREPVIQAELSTQGRGFCTELAISCKEFLWARMDVRAFTYEEIYIYIHIYMYEGFWVWVYKLCIRY